MHPKVQLIRPLTSFMIGLAVFVSAFVGAGDEIIRYAMPVAIATFTAFLFGCASNAFNDYLDRESDRINHPERPLPSGKITPEQALNFAVILFVASGISALFLSVISGYLVFIIVIIAFALQISYEKKFKQEKIIGNVVIGGQTFLAFLFGGVVVGKTEVAGLLAIVAFFSILGREIVKDIEDVKGDIEKNTLPKKIGPIKAGIVAVFFLILAVLISPIPHYLQHFGKEYLLVIAVADLIFVGSIPVIFTNPSLARRIIKVGMIVALIAFIVGRAPIF